MKQGISLIWEVNNNLEVYMDEIFLDNLTGTDANIQSIAKALKGNVVVKKLTLFGCEITPNTLKSLIASAQTTQIKSLCIRNLKMPNKSYFSNKLLELLRPWLETGRLEELDISDNAINFDEPYAFKTLAIKPLKSINLSKHHLGKANGLKSYVSLLCKHQVNVKLYLDLFYLNSEIVDTIIPLLESNLLEALHLGGYGDGFCFTLEFIKALANNRSLKVLRLNDAKSSNHFVPHLDQFISAVKKIDSLIELSIKGFDITSAGAKELAGYLRGRNSVLLKLYLDNNRVSYEGTTIIIQALTENKTLLHFSFARNLNLLKADDALAEELGKLFKKNRVLLNFCFDHNKMTPKYAKIIAEGVAGNSVLEKISLSKCFEQRDSDSARNKASLHFLSNNTNNTLSTVYTCCDFINWQNNEEIKIYYELESLAYSALIKEFTQCTSHAYTVFSFSKIESILKLSKRLHSRTEVLNRGIIELILRFKSSLITLSSPCNHKNSDSYLAAEKSVDVLLRIMMKKNGYKFLSSVIRFYPRFQIIASIANIFSLKGDLKRAWSILNGYEFYLGQEEIFSKNKLAVTLMTDILTVLGVHNNIYQILDNYNNLKPTFHTSKLVKFCIIARTA